MMWLVEVGKLDAEFFQDLQIALFCSSCNYTEHLFYTIHPHFRTQRSSKRCPQMSEGKGHGGKEADRHRWAFYMMSSHVTFQHKREKIITQTHIWNPLNIFPNDDGSVLTVTRCLRYFLPQQAWGRAAPVLESQMPDFQAGFYLLGLPHVSPAILSMATSFRSPG